MKKLTLIMLPLLFGGFAHADSQKFSFDPNDLRIYGQEARCTLIISYLKSRNQNEEDKIKYAIVYYTQGYLSALNFMNYVFSKDHHNATLGKNLNFDYTVEYVRNYCLNNPNDGLPDAVMNLVGKLK